MNVCQPSARRFTVPPRGTRRKISTTEGHQVACTHLSVTRLFDVHDSQRCQMCGRTSPLGWLYRCTQDYNGFLPQADIYPIDNENDEDSWDQQISSDQLSISVLRGIEIGLYDFQQISLLKTQKLRVVESIARQEAEMESSSDSSQASSGYAAPNTASERSSLITADGPASSKQPNTGSKLPYTTGCKDGTPRAKPMLAKCRFTCCANCRPAYRDRAFQSLNQVLSEPIQPPPPWEFENRRISDASHLMVMSTHAPRQQLHGTQYMCCGLEEYTESRASVEDECIDPATKDAQSNNRGRGGFRATVRRALAALDPSKYSREITKPSRKSSSQKSGPKRLKRRSMGTEQENTIVSNKALQESLVLMLAANTPLPRASEDSGGLEIGEVKVEDGVAVTEEGVEMSAADIVFQEQ